MKSRVLLALISVLLCVYAAHSQYSTFSTNTYSGTNTSYTSYSNTNTKNNTSTNCYGGTSYNNDCYGSSYNNDCYGNNYNNDCYGNIWGIIVNIFKDCDKYKDSDDGGCHTPAPIDGGLCFALFAGLGFGIQKAREKRKTEVSTI